MQYLFYLECSILNMEAEKKTLMLKWPLKYRTVFYFLFFIEANWTELLFVISIIAL